MNLKVKNMCVLKFGLTLPQDKEHANMATIGEPRNVTEAIELSDANK